MFGGKENNPELGLEWYDVPGSGDATTPNSGYQSAHDKTNEILERSGKPVNPSKAMIHTKKGKRVITNSKGESEDLN